MPANQIRQTRAVLDAIVLHDGAARGKLGACEEFADLLKRINSEEQSEPFTRRKISAGCSWSWTLM